MAANKTQSWPLMYFFVYAPAPITNEGWGIEKSVHPTVLCHEAFLAIRLLKPLEDDCSITHPGSSSHPGR